MSGQCEPVTSCPRSDPCLVGSESVAFQAGGRDGPGGAFLLRIAATTLNCLIVGWIFEFLNMRLSTFSALWHRRLSGSKSEW